MIYSYLEYYAKTSPDSIAVVYNEESLTYSELNKLVNKLAHFLISKGINSEKNVALILEPSLYLPVAVLAVLKCGGVYIPIMPTYPKYRIEFILNDSKVDIVLTDRKLKNKFNFNSFKSFAVDESYSDFSDENPNCKINEKNTAFIIYTSGSTGKPKGVVIEHRNLSYYIKWYIKNIYAKTRFDLPLTSSMSFAASVTQFYSSLLLGKTLNILNPDLIRQPDKLFEWYAMHQGYGLYCVPSLWEELVNFAENHNNSKVLKNPNCVYLSGEAVPNNLVIRTYNLFPNIKLWNLYGPTEATANISAGELFKNQEVHLGNPIEGSSLFILNKDMNEVGINEIGEIYISGGGIARGYLNLPKLTNEYFFNFKFDNNNSLLLYKTGDLAKYDANRRIIFQGRKDNQVKINGYRIELSEIENILLELKGIRQTVVIKKYIRKENRLIAYTVCENNSNLNISDIRHHLSEHLPDYMLPNVIIILDSFPKLDNGKINRKELPEPGMERPNLNYAYTPPTNDFQKELIEIWEDVLCYEGLGIDDDFFELGGNSLKIISCINRINKKFKIDVPFKYFFKYQTAYKLANKLQNKELKDTNIYPVINTSIKQSNKFTLSFNQESLWFIMQSIPNKSTYNILYSVDMNGEFNLSFLQQSLEKILKRHKQFNSIFKIINNELVCIINEDHYIGIEFIDLSQVQSNELITAELKKIENKEIKFVFDLETGPLYKFKVIKVNDNMHILLILVHHIIFDGWSINIMIKELSDLYTARLNNDKANLPILPFQFYDFANWQKENSKSSYYTKLSRYWTVKLKDSNFVLDFPGDFLRPKNLNNNGNIKEKIIGKSLKDKIWEFNKQNNATPFMTFLSVFKLLLFKYTKQNNILIGCPVANRNQQEIEKLIGYFVNTIVIRTNISDNNTFIELLQNIRETTFEAFENQDFPFSKIVEGLNVERSVSISPVFQVMFAYHNALTDRFGNEKMSFGIKEIHNPAAKYDLVLELDNFNEYLELRIRYNLDLFKNSTIDRLLDEYVYLLSNLIDNPTKLLDEYLLNDDKVLIAKLQEWNSTKTDYSKNKGIHQLIEEQTIRTPDLIAIVFENKELSYNELNIQSNKLARYILAKGVNSGKPIGIQMGTSEKMIISLLAILKIGSPYIPLDPYYPKDRNNYIIDNSQVELIITDDKYFPVLSQMNMQIININQEEDLIDRFSEDNIEINNFTSEDLAYIIYTSGSTGKPKGVMISHKSVCNYLQWMKKTFPMNESDVILNKTSINFDISVWEIFLPLVNGAKLVLARKNLLQAPESLSKLIKKQNITNIQFVPSSLKIFLESGLLSNCKSIKRIFSGGEKLSLDLQNRVFAEFDGDLINFYGPTEACIYMSYWICERQSKLNYVPIGKPIDNAEVFILDSNLNPLPTGVSGELHIGGDVLAKGYLNSPELTENSFITSPFDINKIIYKTGDLAKISDDGFIEFLGRIDHQVKVRGYRIELEEIEYYLVKHKLIKQAIVIIREDIDSDVRIIAYLLSKNSELPKIDELRDFLKDKLPSYMIPSFFIFIDYIPLLANGKLDIKSLPAVPTQTFEKKNIIYNNKYEEIIADIWKEVLGTDRFKPGDNFYDAGGHSLLMIKVRNLIQERLKLSVSIVDLFQYPNIQSLANYFLNKYKSKVNLNTDIAQRVAMRKKNLSPKIKKIIEKYKNDKF